MALLVIFAAICFLVAQIKGDTSVIRMVIAIVGLVLWLLSCLAVIRLPACLTGG